MASKNEAFGKGRNGAGDPALQAVLSSGQTLAEALSKGISTTAEHERSEYDAVRKHLMSLGPENDNSPVLRSDGSYSALGRVLPSDTSHPLWKGLNGYTGTPETEAAFQAANAKPKTKRSSPKKYNEAKDAVEKTIGTDASPTRLPLDSRPNKPDVDTSTVRNQIMDQDALDANTAAVTERREKTPLPSNVNPPSPIAALFKPATTPTRRTAKPSDTAAPATPSIVVDPQTGEVKDSTSYVPETTDPKVAAEKRRKRREEMLGASQRAREESAAEIAERGNADVTDVQASIDAQRSAAPQGSGSSSWLQLPTRTGKPAGKIVSEQLTYEHPKLGPLNIRTDEGGNLVLPHPQTFSEDGKPVPLTQQQAELNLAHYEGFTKSLGGGIQPSNAEAQGAVSSSLRTSRYEYDHPTMGRLNINLDAKGGLILPHSDIDPRDGSQRTLTPEQQAMNSAHSEAFKEIKDQEEARAEVARKKGDFGFTISQPEHKSKVAQRTAAMQAVNGRTQPTAAGGPFMGPTSKDLVGSVRGHLSRLETHVNTLSGMAKTPAQRVALRTAQSALSSANEHSDTISSYESQPRLTGSPEYRGAVADMAESVGRIHDAVNHPELSELAGPSPLDVREVLDNHVIASSHAGTDAFRAPRAGKVKATVKTTAGAAATGLEKGTTVTMDPKDSRMSGVIDLVKNKVRSGQITGPLDEWVSTLSGKGSTGLRLSSTHFTHLANVARGATLANYYAQLENHVRTSTIGNFSEKNGLDETRGSSENLLADRIAGGGPTNPRNKNLEAGDLVPAGGEASLGELGSHLNAVHDHLSKFTASPAPKNMTHFSNAMDSLAKAHAVASRPELGGRLNALPFNMDDVKAHVASITPDTVKVPAVDRGSGGRRSGQGLSVGEMTRPEIFANQRAKPVADLTREQEQTNKEILNPVVKTEDAVDEEGNKVGVVETRRNISPPNPNPMHGSVNEGVSSGPLGTAPIMQPGDRRPGEPVPVEKLGQQLLRGELRDRMTRHLKGEPGHVERIAAIKSELSARFKPANRALLDADFDPDKAEAEAAKPEGTPEPPKGA